MNIATPPSRIQPDTRQQDTDGGVYVTREQLEKLGGGDARLGRRELRLMLTIDRDGPEYNGPTERPLSVRIGTPADEPALLKLWLMDLQANAAHVAMIDEGKVLANIQVGTRNRGGTVGVIDAPDGSIAGMVVLHPLEWHWSNGCFMQEMVNFVHPDHRVSRHADDLMDFMRWWTDAGSKRLGYRVYLLCGVLGTWKLRLKLAKYRRRFASAGGVFIYPAPEMRGN